MLQKKNKYFLTLCAEQLEVQEVKEPIAMRSITQSTGVKLTQKE